MEKASTEVTELIQSYYKAFGEKDIATLKTIEDGFTPADESQINSRDYIDGYEVQDVYAKKGLTDDSYVVYVVFNYICTGIETPVPALSQFYVETDGDGNLKIKGGADEDTDISTYVKKLESESDVKALIAQVKANYDAAQENDSALAEFLQGLGDDASASAETGTMLTVTEDCNVRASADSEGEVIGGFSAGTEVEKKGQEGDWIQVDYDGQTGYIYSGLLE
ncbi:SH3 domain-containing protein [Blautia schinkii]|nr:SH3 domain-containing protein [Blautia schinkii]NSK21753.1 SH3 domain-containing protein [Blautia schinkii]NSK24796.1 SH3 domain-containing protein [Blautia schinkii]NSK31390.1 SH3 domain-containing protein [Blautia schinkii]NSK36611.1 SH3 domain-containing protein [Blautia schinkii]